MARQSDHIASQSSARRLPAIVIGVGARAAAAGAVVGARVDERWLAAAWSLVMVGPERRKQTGARRMIRGCPVNAQNKAE